MRRRRVHARRSRAGGAGAAQGPRPPRPGGGQAVVDPNEPPLPGNINSKQALHFAEAIVRGDKHGYDIIKTDPQRQGPRSHLDSAALASGTERVRRDLAGQVFARHGRRRRTASRAERSLRERLRSDAGYRGGAYARGAISAQPVAARRRLQRSDRASRSPTSIIAAATAAASCTPPSILSGALVCRRRSWRSTIRRAARSVLRPVAAITLARRADRLLLPCARHRPQARRLALAPHQHHHGSAGVCAACCSASPPISA